MKMVENNVVAMYRDGECIIEICREEDAWFAYLQKENYGIKMGMFGVPFDYSMEVFISLVEGNLEDYIKIYEEEGYGS